MNVMNRLQPFTPMLVKPIRNLAAGALALALGLLAGASNVHAATTYNWTNTDSSAYLDNPNNWNPVGGPGSLTDTFTYAVTGTRTLLISNNVLNVGSFQFGAASAGADPQP